MPSKINPATKQLALQKLRDGLTAKEVADLTGVSIRTLQDWNRKRSGKSGIPGGKPAQTQVATPAAADAQKAQEQTQEDKTTLDFEASPAPVEHKGAVDSALSALKGMLGISDKKDAKTSPPPLSGKLTEKQQNFVDSFSPMLTLGFVTIAAWVWGRIGSEYRHLKPSDEVAQRIVEPLIRIYARHAKFVESINPDVTDVGASMFALVAYVQVSLELYQQIKQEKEEDDERNGNGWRNYRPGPTPESGAGNQSDRYADVQRPNGVDDIVNGSNGGHPGSVNIPALSDKEARQYAALSRLSQLDYQHRARRSGSVR